MTYFTSELIPREISAFKFPYMRVLWCDGKVVGWVNSPRPFPFEGCGAAHIWLEDGDLVWLDNSDPDHLALLDLTKHYPIERGKQETIGRKRERLIEDADALNKTLIAWHGKMVKEGLDIIRRGCFQEKE